MLTLVPHCPNVEGVPGLYEEPRVGGHVGDGVAARGGRAARDAAGHVRGAGHKTAAAVHVPRGPGGVSGRKEAENGEVR